jgi:NADH-quinone oxidoreductase subunit C
MMHAETFAILQATFPEGVVSMHADAVEPFVVVRPEAWREIAVFLKNDARMGFAILNNISGVDYLEPDAKKAAKAGYEPHVEVVYHLSSFAEPGRRVTVKLLLPRWKDGVAGQLPEVPTVSDIWRTADWHEREVWDLVGVLFAGHPDLRRILMNDDWIGHPLRKDYEMPLEYHEIRCR